MLLQTQFLSSVQFQHSFPVLYPSVWISNIKSEKGSSESSSSDGSGRKGFGSSSDTGGKRKQKKGQRERASIIRRTPLEKPPFVSEQQQVSKGSEEENKNESAFLLAWLGFGLVILVEGISLAASGFLPEQWDQLFVKYLYPSFTPTVFLFVAGGVVYGVFKYLQNEKITDQK